MPHCLLPPLLSNLIRRNEWHQPDDDVVRQLVPFDDLPFDFHLTEAAIESDTLHDLLPFNCFNLCSSRRGDPYQDLPAIDVDLARCIAGGRIHGSDSAIALDFRISESDPRVVATNWQSGTCGWDEVAASFTEFVTELRRIESGT